MVTLEALAFSKDFSFIIFTQAFAADFLEEKLKPFYKSDPIPETVSYFACLSE